MKLWILLVCAVTVQSVLLPEILRDAVSRQKRGLGSDPPDCPELQSYVNAPQECRSAGLFAHDNAVYVKAAVNPTTFASLYCSNICGQVVYDYYKECDKENDTASFLDLLCARNSDGLLCANAASEDFVAAINSTFSCRPTSTDRFSCKDGCKNLLEHANDAYGCCSYSINSLFYSSSALVNVSYSNCGVDTPGLCIGNFTDAPIEIPEEPHGGNFTNGSSQCDLLLSSLPEECALYFLGLSEGFPVFSPHICKETCKAPIKEVFIACSAIEESLVTYLEFSCAKNVQGTTCSQFLETLDNEQSQRIFEEFNETCIFADDICSQQCQTKAEIFKADGGCCIEYMLALINPFAYFLDQLCSSSKTGLCISSFTDAPLELPYDSGNEFEGGLCRDLYESLSMECQPFVNPFFFVFDASLLQYHLNFCDSQCAKPLYDFYVECDKVTGNDRAADLDFICSSSKNGTDCVYTFSDPVLQICDEAGPDNCPAQCSRALKRANEQYGCCLYTLVATRLTNDTFAKGLWESCDAEIPNLCAGAFSEDTRSSTKFTTASYIVLFLAFAYSHVTCS